MRAEIFGMTDIGKCRELNEDNYRIVGFEGDGEYGAMVLADGMGGHNAGEVASAMAVELIGNEIEKYLEVPCVDIPEEIANAIDYANAQIYEMSLKNPEQSGMGTTTVVAILKDSIVRIANIGDSRAYLVSDGKISKITVDHSVVEQLIQSGSISREEAKHHPDKNIITRALGTESYIDADFYEYKPKVGDKLLICSDGLYEMVDDDMVLSVIEGENSAETAVKSLIELANKNGGTDNITAILMSFKSDKEEGKL